MFLFFSIEIVSKVSEEASPLEELNLYLYNIIPDIFAICNQSEIRRQSKICGMESDNIISISTPCKRMVHVYQYLIQK